MIAAIVIISDEYNPINNHLKIYDAIDINELM